jgi:hypothetical protein
MTIVSFLIIAWILSWFRFEQIFVQAFKELFIKKLQKQVIISSFFVLEQ